MHWYQGFMQDLRFSGYRIVISPDLKFYYYIDRNFFVELNMFAIFGLLI
jgi:hypothetical protein